jgi:hypothetical protein
MLNSGWMEVLGQLIETYVACRMLNSGWMEVLGQLIETYGEERALRLAGPSEKDATLKLYVFLKILQPGYKIKGLSHDMNKTKG